MLQQSQVANDDLMEKMREVPGAICFAVNAWGAKLGGVTTKSSARTVPASRSTNDRTKTRIASEVNNRKV
jgi:hypothetical protein